MVVTLTTGGTGGFGRLREAQYLCIFLEKVLNIGQAENRFHEAAQDPTFHVLLKVSLFGWVLVAAELCISLFVYLFPRPGT